jgi:glycosyltransferase involved in cell wall biosynthesis
LILAIQALASLVAGAPDIHLCLVGRDDGEGPKLRRAAADLGVASRVHFLGYQADARALLPGFDIFTLPSLCEGQPIALLEAMDAGLPVVASNVGGIPEVVEHGVTGFLAPSGDAQALAAHLLTLSLDPRLRASMGRAGREKVRRDHDIGRTANEYAGLYRMLLQEWQSS